MEQLKTMTDEQLAIKYMEGNNQAFDILLSRNQNKLFAYILFVVHDEGLANDVFQETFVKIIVKLQNGLYEPSGQFAAWCMRIAHNVIMDTFRRQKARHIVEPNEDNDLGKLRHRQIWEGNVEGRYGNEQYQFDWSLLVVYASRYRNKSGPLRVYSIGKYESQRLMGSRERLISAVGSQCCTCTIVGFYSIAIYNNQRAHLRAR